MTDEIEPKKPQDLIEQNEKINTAHANGNTDKLVAETVSRNVGMLYMLIRDRKTLSNRLY